MALNSLLVGSVKVTAASDENIQQSIAVIVDECDAPAQGFENGVLVRLLPISIDMVQPRLGGDILEPCRSVDSFFVIGLVRVRLRLNCRSTPGVPSKPVNGPTDKEGDDKSNRDDESGSPPRGARGARRGHLRRH